VKQIIDAGSEPTDKDKLLSGQLNLAICPQCGNGGMLNAPLVFHDPAHDLLLTYVPMELNLPSEQREQLIGSLIRELISRIPAEARKGYLFNPQAVLTMDSLVERILQADGIPAEVLDLQRKQSRLLSRLMQASEAELPSLAQLHDADIDESFFQILAAVVGSARRAGRDEEAEAYIRLRNRLLPLASWSKDRRISPQALDEQQARVELIEQFLAAHESSWSELAREKDRQLDYLFFQLLTAIAEGADGGDKDKLYQLREELMNSSSTGKAAKSSQEAVEKLRTATKATGELTREVLLDQILDAGDSDAEEAIAVAGGALLDYSFFLLLADRIDAAERGQNKDDVARLTALRDRLVTLTTEWERIRQARVERVDRQLNKISSADDQAEAVRKLLPEIDEFFLSVLYSRIEAAKAGGQEKLSAGLTGILELILDLIKSSAPPEVQFINELMDLEDKAAVEKMMASRPEDLTLSLLAVITEMVESLRSSGRDSLVEQLEAIQFLVAERLDSRSEFDPSESL
jgi:hypothetical protein